MHKYQVSNSSTQPKMPARRMRPGSEISKRKGCTLSRGDTGEIFSWSSSIRKEVIQYYDISNIMISDCV
jgi:hypothetical protein